MVQIHFINFNTSLLFPFGGICEKFIKECIGQGKVQYDPNLHELVARGKCETLNANLVMSI